MTKSYELFFDAPYFVAKRSDGILQTRGTPKCSFGHKIVRSNGVRDGIFAEWNWDGATLEASNDRYGFYPLYYYNRGNEIGVSTSIARLVAESGNSDIDEEAVAVAVRLGQFLGDDTPFRHIRCLPPRAKLMWNGKCLLTGGYEFAKPVQGISRADALARYHDLFTAAIELRRPKRSAFAVPLSGGRDSRHILFALCSSGFKPQVCVTALQFPDDVRVAAIVTRELGIPHVVLEQTSDFFELELRKNDITNFCVDEGTWPLLMTRFFEHNGIEAIYDGIAGDVLSAGLFLTPELDTLFRTANPAAIASSLLPDNTALLDRLLAHSLRQRIPRSLAIDRLSNEVERHKHAHNPVTSFFFWNRTRRKIAQTPWAMLVGSFTVYAPYLDHDVFDFLSSLPTHMIVDHQFHTDAILTAYPHWAHLPFQDKEGPGHDFSAQYAEFARQFGRHVGFFPKSRWLRRESLAARLFASRISRRFAAGSNWYLRPALWLYQLEELAQLA